jgi:periplasmic divalent cation tolerance protein
MTNYIFYVTVPNFEEGKKIAKLLVERKVVACVNIIKEIYSVYRWKDKIEENNEVLLIIKTSGSKSEQLIKIINEIHSYEIPECVGVKIEKGSKIYIDWINNVISNSSKPSLIK